jgi:hypothetical protein
MRGRMGARGVPAILGLAWGALAGTAFAQTGPGQVVVHIDSPSPVDLERETDTAPFSFYRECTSPCDEAVPVGGDYRIHAVGVPASRVISFSSGSKQATVRVRPGSRLAGATGDVLVVSGVAAMFVALEGVVSAGGGDTGPSNRALVVGVVGASGLVAVGVGVALLLLSAPTDVKVIPGPPVSAVETPSMLPTGGVAGRAETSVVMVPLVSGVF